jgi:hypothetical protein
LTPVQADGLAWAVCGADYLRVHVPHVPIGRSGTGSQVFACVDCRPDDKHSEPGGVVCCGERHHESGSAGSGVVVQCACTALVALGAA